MFQAKSSLEYLQQQRFELDVNHCSMLLKEVHGKIFVLHACIVYTYISRL